MVADINPTSNSFSFSTPLSFSYSQKVYNAGGITVNAYVIQGGTGTVISTGTQTIAIDKLDGNKIPITFTNQKFFGCLSTFSAGLPTVIKASFSLNAIVSAAAGLIALTLSDSTYTISTTSGCLAFTSVNTNFITQPLKCAVTHTGANYFFSISSPVYSVPSSTSIEIYFSMDINTQIGN